jgi:hypothetical protein
MSVVETQNSKPKTRTVKTCRHIMPSGKTCGTFALRYQDFCYFHNEQRKREMRKARAARSCSCPYFPRLPMDPALFSECPAVVAARLGILTPASCREIVSDPQPLARALAEAS